MTLFHRSCSFRPPLDRVPAVAIITSMSKPYQARPDGPAVDLPEKQFPRVGLWMREYSLPGGRWPAGARNPKADGKRSTVGSLGTVWIQLLPARRAGHNLKPMKHQPVPRGRLLDHTYMTAGKCFLGHKAAFGRSILSSPKAALK